MGIVINYPPFVGLLGTTPIKSISPRTHKITSEYTNIDSTQRKYKRINTDNREQVKTITDNNREGKERENVVQ